MTSNARCSSAFRCSAALYMLRWYAWSVLAAVAAEDLEREGICMAGMLLGKVLGLAAPILLRGGTYSDCTV